MVKREGKKKEKHIDPEDTEKINRPNNYWQIPVIIIILIVLGFIVSLAQYYKASSTPMECYYCNWISRSDGPSLVDDPCGHDQRSRPNNANVKTCAADQSYCGTLHISFSYMSVGRVKQFEFAFVRDCFATYPMPYVMQIDRDNRTYYGTREGSVYPNLAGMGLNMTVVGQQCSFWNKCNSNIPRDGLGWAFLDSVNILYQARQKGLSVWHALVDFIQQENVANNSTPVFFT